MLENIKQTVKHTGIYALGNISAKLVGFVLLPIYTKHISVAAYGVWGLLELVDMLAVHIMSVGLPQALLRWYGLEDSEIKKRNYVFTQFIFVLIVSICCTSLIIVFKKPLSQLLFNKSVNQDYLIYLFIAITFTILNKIPLSLLRLENKSIYYAICIVCQFTISLILNVWFIAFLKLGVKGILMSHMISSGCIFLILLPKVIRYMHAKFDKDELIKMIQFSYPFIFSAIGATIISMGNRYLLKYLGSFADVGIFTLGHKFSNILKIFLIDAFSLGLPIIGWQVIKANQDPKRFFSKSMTYLIFASLWIALGIAAFSKGIIHRFAQSQEYWSAASIVPILVLGVVLIGMHRILFFILQIPKQTKYIPIIVCGVSIANIGFNFILIPRFGVMGSAYATLLSYILMNVLAYIVAQKFYPVKYEFKRLVTLFIVAIGLFCLTLLFNSTPFVWRIFIKSVIIVSFPLVLYLIGFYEPVELDRILYFLKTKFGIFKENSL